MSATWSQAQRLIRAKLEAAADKACHALAEFRKRCPHPNVKKVARSNAGNYDPSADRYWYDCSCEDCGAAWTEAQ